MVSNEGIVESLSQMAEQWLGLRLSAKQEAALEWYGAELLRWNERMNLTAIRTPEDVRVKHFLDSLSVLTVTGCLNGKRVVDVGTGAGFPGLVLKIACPQMRLTLVEAVGKKLNFCEHVAAELGLDGVEFLHARAEEIGRQDEHREAYDVAVARAVARLPVLAEYLLPLVRLGGVMVAQKGETAPQEVQAAQYAVGVLGGFLEKVQKVELPHITEARYLVLVRKVAPTPARYPRRAGIPSKRPLAP